MNLGVGGYVAQIAGPFLVLLLIGGTMIALRRRGRAGDGGVPDGPEDEPYRVYTRAYDLELNAGEAVDALPDASLDRPRGYQQCDRNIWDRWAARTEILVADQDDLAAQRLPALRTAAAGLDPNDIAVALLIDQSGSMKGEPIAHAAATADILARLIAGLGAHSEILGFSTAGWQGGRAYEAWKFGGRPKRPGRLCALMHVVYKSAAEPALADDARRAIVHPDLLRENVDGEALLWAAGRLTALPARHKLLLVLSDGAPVDDATLMHNGLSFLHRHLIQAVRDVDAGGTIVGALGINHPVEIYYPLSDTVTALDAMPAAAAALLERMLVAAAERAAAPA